MSRKPLFIAAAVVATAAVGVLAWYGLRDQATPATIEASGRIEGRITLVTPKVSGTVAALPVDEGQAAQAGALLARLEEPALLERQRAAQARTAGLERQLQAQRIDYEVAQRELPLKIAQARSALTEARARLAAARADRAQADTDAGRLAALAARQLTSPQQAETARLRADVAAKTEQAAQAAVRAAADALALAQLGDRRLAALHEGIASLERQVEQARAQAAELDTQLGYLDIPSPLSGVVLTRSVELGEQVAPGSPLFSLVDLNRLYLKVYVPEPLIGRIALGQRAEVRVDAYPDRAFPATVTKVATSAEFTPKNVETKEERVKLVFAVELSLTENPGGVLKPGMPADGLVYTDTAAQSQGRSAGGPAGAP